MSNNTNNEVKKETAKKKRAFPHAFVILCGILALITILTWIVPAGQFTREMVDGRNVVVPGSFQYVESKPVGFMEMFESIPRGISNGVALITMIFTIGAAVGLVDSTGAIKAAVVGMTKKLGDKGSKYILIALILYFVFIGAFPSMLEGVIPFVPICIGIALMLGYDVLTGIAVVIVSDVVGWAAGPTNMWTVGNAQAIGGLPLFSGIEYRLFTMVVFAVITIAYIVNYAEKVKKDPTRSYCYGMNTDDLGVNLSEQLEFTGRRKLVLLTFIITIFLVVIGSLQWGWGLTEMSAVYLICGIICGIIAGFKSGEIADKMLAGAQTVFVAAMAIGIARAISIVMEDGLIIDTFVYYLSEVVSVLPSAVVGIAMFIVQIIINFFVPSGSSQALVTMPILMPLAEITGISKQITILAFQFGDGLSNLAFPTMGALIACLACGKISFDVWFKFIWKYLIIIFIAACALLIGATLIGY